MTRTTAALVFVVAALSAPSPGAQSPTPAAARVAKVYAAPN